jgi:hypothetical protein
MSYETGEIAPVAPTTSLLRVCYGDIDRRVKPCLTAPDPGSRPKISRPKMRLHGWLFWGPSLIASPTRPR